MSRAEQGTALPLLQGSETGKRSDEGRAWLLPSPGEKSAPKGARSEGVSAHAVARTWLRARSPRRTLTCDALQQPTDVEDAFLHDALHTHGEDRHQGHSAQNEDAHG